MLNFPLALSRSPSQAKAILLPSGENAGSASWPGRDVNGTVCSGGCVARDGERNHHVAARIGAKTQAAMTSRVGLLARPGDLGPEGSSPTPLRSARSSAAVW